MKNMFLGFLLLATIIVSAQNKPKEVLFAIDDKPISIVKSFSHLGHLINSDLSYDDDIVKRRNDFIGQINNNLCHCKSCTLMYSIGCFSLIVRVIIVASYCS